MKQRGKSPRMSNFVLPEGIADCEDRLLILTADTRTIQSHLSDKHRRKENGEAMTQAEYENWRARAAYALASKQNEAAFLKHWLRRHHVALAWLETCEAFDIETDQPIELLAASYGLLRRKKVCQTKGELALLTTIQDHLRNTTEWRALANAEEGGKVS